MCVPRLPSYLLQKQSKDRPVKIMTFEDMADQNLSKYGLVGSPTAVEKMFAQMCIRDRNCSGLFTELALYKGISQYDYDNNTDKLIEYLTHCKDWEEGSRREEIQ